MATLGASWLLRGRGCGLFAAPPILNAHNLSREVRVEALRSALGLDQSFLRRPGRALVFRVSTSLGGGKAARADARRRLQAFARKLNHFFAVE